MFVVDPSVTESIQDNIPTLIQCLDVDNGLADCLFSRGVLSPEQYERLTNKSFLPSPQEQNHELLSNMLPTRLKSKFACTMFMVALVETDQRHIFNFIMNSKGLLSDVQCFFNSNSLSTIVNSVFKCNCCHVLVTHPCPDLVS